jgi:hypothetical protein
MNPPKGKTLRSFFYILGWRISRGLDKFHVDFRDHRHFPISVQNPQKPGYDVFAWLKTRRHAIVLNYSALARMFNKNSVEEVLHHLAWTSKFESITKPESNLVKFYYAVDEGSVLDDTGNGYGEVRHKKEMESLQKDFKEFQGLHSALDRLDVLLEED